MKSGNRTSSNPIDTADASEIRRSPIKKQVKFSISTGAMAGFLNHQRLNHLLQGTQRPSRKIPSDQTHEGMRKRLKQPPFWMPETLQRKKMAPKKISSLASLKTFSQVKFQESFFPPDFRFHGANMTKQKQEITWF